jgi:hypothetical protein
MALMSQKRKGGVRRDSIERHRSLAKTTYPCNFFAISYDGDEGGAREEPPSQ